jgi:hypothetical protein
LISIDYETYLIGNGSVFPKPICLSHYDGKDTGLLNQTQGYHFLSEYLNKELIIAHNAVFECGVTVTHYPDLADLVFDALDNGLIYCTKINEALWNTQREKQKNKLDLASLVLDYFGKDISSTKGEDAWRLRYSELDGIPISNWPKEAVDYAIDDSIWAYKIKQNQEPVNQLLALKSAVYLNLMGSRGFSIKKDRVELLEHERWEYLTPRYDFLVKEGFCDYLGKKPRKQTKKLKQYIEDLGLELQYTKKGGTATSGEALSSYLTQQEDPILRAFSELTKYEKILTSYIRNLKTDIIYTQYSTTLKTSRTSSSESKLFSSVNIQQMPRVVEGVTYDVRNCFVPRDGFKICSIDYSALELCSAAHQLYTKLGYSKMRDMLNEGDKPVDPHSKLAASRKGIPYEEFMEHKSGKYKEDRQKAKPLNLSFPGGVGYDTMRYLMSKDGIKTYFQILEKSRSKKDLEFYLYRLALDDLRIKRLNKREYALVRDELVAMKRDLFKAYPELEQFLKDTHKKFLNGKTRWKKNDFGEWEEEELYRYETHGFIRDNCNYTALCNGYLMQSPSAIGAQRATCRVIKHFYNSPDIIPKVFIHDEIVFEVREGRYDLSEEAAYIMLEDLQLEIPTVRVAAEESWSDYWQKADGFYNKKHWRDAA